MSAAIDLGAQIRNAEGVPQEIRDLVLRLKNEKLDSNQLGMLIFIERCMEESNSPIVVKASRQIGKSWFLVYLAIACALSIPGAQIKYAAPTGKQARLIVRPHFRDLTSLLPSSMWKFNAQIGEYTFFHPDGRDAVVTIGGCDAGNIESLRGTASHIIIMDEAGFVADLSYAIDDVLKPQTITTNGIIVMASSPAKTMAHPFKGYCDRAAAANRLLVRTIYDCPRLSPEKIAEWMKDARGPHSSTWRREYLAEDVPDQKLAVLPNLTTPRALSMAYDLTGKIQSVERKEISRPKSEFAQWDTYVSVSLGFGPKNTGVLFAYWHPVEKAIVIEREAELIGTDTWMLNKEIREGEAAVWSGTPHEAGAKRRFGNFEPVLMGQMQKEHKLRVSPSIPGDVVLMANSARLRIEGNEFRINHACEGLLRQMQCALWKESMTEFEYSDLDADQALLKSLVTLAWNVKREAAGDGAAKGMRKLLSGGNRRRG